MPLSQSNQQDYYSYLAARLPQPFNAADWKFTGFRQYVKKMVTERSEEASLILASAWEINPDAYALFPEEQAVILEVVETNDVDEEKARRINNVFWALDEAGVQLSVLLFYPATSAALFVEPMTLEARAHKLKGRKHPFRDAFQTLKQVVVPSSHLFPQDKEQTQVAA